MAKFILKDSTKNKPTPPQVELTVIATITPTASGTVYLTQPCIDCAGYRHNTGRCRFLRGIKCIDAVERHGCPLVWQNNLTNNYKMKEERKKIKLLIANVLC
jgi:hypothetical protein